VRRFFGLLILLTAALGGCTVGPDYRPPPVAAPEAWHADPVSEPADLGPSAWWESLGDEQLTRYVRASFSANHEVAMARARLVQARAARRVATAGLWPQLSGGAVARRAALSESGGSAGSELAEIGVADSVAELFQAGFDAAWELDLFGRTRRQGEAAAARAEAAEAQLADVARSIAAEVALAYVELRGAQRRLAVVEDNVRVAQETLAVVTDLHGSGLVPELDLHRARLQLGETRAGLPPLRAAATTAAYRLSVLLGRSPGALYEEVEEPGPIPTPTDAVPAGLPSELVRRRPDLRAAERELHAATAEVGAAVATLYPTFSLTGAAGAESDRVGDLAASQSSIWSVGAGAAWPVFRGGALRGNVEVSRARLEEAGHRYRQAVLGAWLEVESALARHAQAELERQHLTEATEAARLAFARAEVQYAAGLTDFLDLLDAERSLVRLEDRLAVAQTEVVVRIIALYKALGGGWPALSAGG